MKGTNINPILVETTRGPIVEMVHRGSAILLNEAGQIHWCAGDIETPTYPRSALKFIQVLPLIVSGAAEHFGFDDEEIAVMCASHNSEPEHLAVVRRILEKAGLSESDLGCGAHNPIRIKTMEALLISGQRPTDIHNNCSGKHAGFLALAKFLKSPLETYLNPAHPVQKMIRENVCQLSSLKESDLVLGIDGCSAPNFGMSLQSLATIFLKLVRPDIEPGLNQACRRVLKAVSEFPFMVAGTDRFCTDLMQVTKGKVIGKLGAAGVYAFAIPEQGMAGAVKIDDGLHGPQYQVVEGILRKLEVLENQELHALGKYKVTVLKNYKQLEIGQTRLKNDALMDLMPLN